MIARYTRPAMGRIWSEENKFRTWLKVEIAATDTLFQGVTIPPTATSARFSYWLSVMTDEPGPGANDILTVQVLDSSGSLLDTLATHSNLDAGPYAQYSFDLSPYRGQAIVLLMTLKLSPLASVA